MLRRSWRSPVAWVICCSRRSRTSCAVSSRTAELQALNNALTAEITQREQAGRELTAQLVRLRLLQQITQATGERQDLRSIYQVVLATVEDHLPVDFGLICLHEPGGDVLSIASIGVKSQALADTLDLHLAGRIAIDQNGLARCTKGALVHEPDLTALDLPFARVLAGAGLHALVLAPLRVESRVFGVLVAARRNANSFSSGECEFLRQLCEQVALAAHQMQLYQALQQAYDEQRQTQAAVMQQERLRALGQMASGIAHDINNALTPVTLYTEYLLEREPDLSKRARNYLGNIGRAVGDVAATIGRMREFYRQRENQAALTAVQLNDLVAQVVDFTRARWHDMPQQRGVVINVVTELADTPPTIPGLANELRDAFTNLIFNAVDALPDGGTITIRTSVIMRRPNSKSGPFPTQSGVAGAMEPAAMPHQVRLTISDNGVGMSDEVRRRCMELFFTTKGERGTGLGLAMVYGAMQRHGAEIEIDSAAGRGTTVLMTFPLAGAASLAGANGAPAVTGPLPSLRLLVIDDDPLLLAALTDILGADGHRITTADGGQAGINAFRAALAEGVPFAAVITDLGMPYIDGRRVATAVKAVAPDTPVLLLTGWGQRLVAEGDVPEGIDAVLSKPPKISELRAALSEYCRPT